MGIESREQKGEIREMITEKPHKKLKLWGKTIDLIEMVYEILSTFPKDEKFGLISQMKRSSISIASNIAEGAARGTSKDKVHFFIIARGSASELDAQLEISLRLKFLDENKYEVVSLKLEEVGKMLSGLIKVQAS